MFYIHEYEGICFMISPLPIVKGAGLLIIILKFSDYLL